MNFNPEKLTNPKERFVWITINYILNILNKLENANTQEYDILLSVLNMNITTLKAHINCYDNRLDKILFLANFKKIDHDLFTDIFTLMIEKIPLHMTGDEFF
jgi:hypothetical protein